MQENIIAERPHMVPEDNFCALLARLDDAEEQLHASFAAAFNNLHSHAGVAVQPEPRWLETTLLREVTHVLQRSFATAAVNMSESGPTTPGQQRGVAFQQTARATITATA